MSNIRSILVGICISCCSRSVIRIIGMCSIGIRSTIRSSSIINVSIVGGCGRGIGMGGCCCMSSTTRDM